MIRDDLSNKLIHFTRGQTRQAAAETFLKILEEKKLRGGDGEIKGKWKCVCFTEAPISKLAAILANPVAHGSRYEPYGFMIDKTWLFKKGGRPVIYQSDSEYELLPDSFKYRHVRYEPDNLIDFTWEREWRIHTDAVDLDPKHVTLIVPERLIKDGLIDIRLEDIYHEHQDPNKILEKISTPYPWHFMVLSDLGIQIKSF
jgi:hypothetical protein